MPGKELEIYEKRENEKLAYDIYSPVIKFQNESIAKRDMDSFFEARGSHLDKYLKFDNQSLADEYHNNRLKMATAANSKRKNRYLWAISSKR